MTYKELVDRIAALPERPRDTRTVPPNEVIGFVVRWNRGLRQWKVSTLADYARVSVSTIERVERGESVSVEALDRIAKAFGYEAGYFTAPRIPLPREEEIATLLEQYSNLEVVPVSRMRTHRAIRNAAQCQAHLIHRPNVPESYDAGIETLREWLDLAAFELSDLIDHRFPSNRGRRALYDGILGCVRELERRGLTVLTGVMDAPQEGFPEWKVAVVSITPKLTDPGAGKRRHFMVDRRIVGPPM